MSDPDDRRLLEQLSALILAHVERIDAAIERIEGDLRKYEALLPDPSTVAGKLVARRIARAQPAPWEPIGGNDGR